LAPPESHKEVANFLKDKVEGEAKIAAFRDNNDSNPIPVGEFGSGKKKLYTSIGAFDMHLNLPLGNFEFASYGDLDWLPNVIASSIYWLKERSCSEWPLVCEDVVKHNAKSTYRHMAYVPATFALKVTTGQEIQWLLGVPITDKEVGISVGQALEKAKLIYPEWLFRENA
jgi:hypothetical protein